MNPRSPQYDIGVIGAGAAGLTAAREAVRRGANTVLISDGALGGECTHTGCVPSKTLLAAAAQGASFRDAMRNVQERIGAIAATEDEASLGREGIEVIRGRARLDGGGRIVVDGRPIRSRRIILATGTTPEMPPVPQLADASPLTNETLFSLRRQPRRLVILGGGAIGAEMAQAFQMLGTEVTIVEAESRLLGQEEPEASAVIRSRLERNGVDVRVGAHVEKVERRHDGEVCLRLMGGATVVGDQFLVATGRQPTTSDLGLTEAGVELDAGGYVKTDERLATTADGVWAIGDVTGRMLFTHAAAQMALVAVANALAPWWRFARRRFDRAPIPWVTFTAPEVARVGMTEAEAAAHGGRVAFLPFSELDRAVIAGETDGFVKLIAGPRRVLGNVGGGQILGATIVGPSSGEMISEIALAMRTKMFTGRLAQTTHAYPTWSMATQLAAAQFFMTYDGRSARPAQSAGQR